MIDPKHFLRYIIEPTMQAMPEKYRGDNVNRLLLGTAIAESRLTYLHQIGGGPALGVYQIEPDTHDDVWTNFVNLRPDLRDIVARFRCLEPSTQGAHGDLIYNMAYATVIARLIYWRAPASLPDWNDTRGLAEYWKRYYNTSKGAGTPEKFIDAMEGI